MSQNEKFFMKMLENGEFRSFIMDMFEEVYDGLNDRTVFISYYSDEPY